MSLFSLLLDCRNHAYAQMQKSDVADLRRVINQRGCFLYIELPDRNVREQALRALSCKGALEGITRMGCIEGLQL